MNKMICFIFIFALFSCKGFIYKKNGDNIEIQIKGSTAQFKKAYLVSAYNGKEALLSETKPIGNADGDNVQENSIIFKIEKTKISSNEDQANLGLVDYQLEAIVCEFKDEDEYNYFTGKTPYVASATQGAISSNTSTPSTPPLSVNKKLKEIDKLDYCNVEDVNVKLYIKK